MLPRMAVQWDQIRRGLANARTACRRQKDGKSWTLRDLEAASGVDLATIHRLENTKRYPDHHPDLETLEALTAAMGLTLSRFFASVEGVDPPEVNARSFAGIEGEPNKPLNPPASQTDNPPTVKATPNDGGQQVSAEERRRLDIAYRGIERLGAVLERYLARLEPSHQQAPAARARAPKRRKRDHSGRRKTA